jgi:hypothetical protein
MRLLICLHWAKISGKAKVTYLAQSFPCSVLINKSQTKQSEFGNLVINAYGLFRINVHKVKNKRPALVRCSTGSVADSVGAKIGIFSEISKKNAKFFKFFLLMPPS